MPVIACGNSKFVAPLVIAFGILIFAFFAPYQWIAPLWEKQETCFLYAAIVTYRCKVRALFVPSMPTRQFQEMLEDKKRACESIEMVEFVDDAALGNYAVVSLKRHKTKYRVYLSKELSNSAMLKLQNYQILTFSSYRCI